MGTQNAMDTQKKRKALLETLRKSVTPDDKPELEADLYHLFETLSGEELVEAVINRVQEYAAYQLDLKQEDDEFVRMTDFIANTLAQHISSFTSDLHKAFIVRCHAQGFSTAEAVEELIKADNIMYRLAQNDAMGTMLLRKILIHRLSYLKPGSSRWSEKKYGAVWREARQEYRQALEDIPLSSKVEQVALLAKQADRLHKDLEQGNIPGHDVPKWSNSLNKTIMSLNKITNIDDQPIPVKLTVLEQQQILANLSAPQLGAFLQRLTVALKAPDQQIIEGEAKELVAGLEQLTVALQLPAQQSNSVKALPAEADSTTE